MSGFEPFADWWDRSVGESGDTFHRQFSLPGILTALGRVEGLRALDFGCGNGSSSRPLARLGARVTGVDISPTLVERARAYEQAEPLGVDYAVSDGNPLPFPDGAFDLAISDMVLMDVADLPPVLREIGRVLKPGGRFVSSLFHPCFQPAGGSSWVIEEGNFGDNQIARKVWQYRGEQSMVGFAKPDQPEPHTYYDRSLQWYADHLRAAGLLIDTLDEPFPSDEMAQSSPNLAARNAVIPLLLILGVTKVG